MRLGKVNYLLHVVNHEDDDSARVEDENGDDVDQRVALHLTTLLAGERRCISEQICFVFFEKLINYDSHFSLFTVINEK
jgi:hypothetical protein